MLRHFPVELAVAIFTVTRPIVNYLAGDRILVRPAPQGTVYELYRRLRRDDVEDVIAPDAVELTATEPVEVYAEACRLFAQLPASQPARPRLVR